MKPDAYHAFMLDHASGTLLPEQALAAQLHMLLSEDGRTMADIWSVAAKRLGRPAMLSNMEQHFLPEALELARADLSKVPWKRGLSGVHYAKRGKDRGQLMRLDPGQAAPEHSHSAIEATVVLSGEFEDGHGRYSRGDMVIAAPGMTHRPAAYGNERCVCYIAKGALPFWRLS